MDIEISDLCKRTIERGTEVGFNKEEIEKTNTEDLILLKKSISLYLRSKTLKKRNANFMDAYKRINEEIKQRKNLIKIGAESINKGYVKAEILLQRSRSTSEMLSTSASREEISNGDVKLMNRKHTMCIDVTIPSFLNDKKQKKEENESRVVQKKEEVDKPILKSCLTDFGRGLFDEKLDFDASDDMDNFKVSKKYNFDYELKDIEIKSAIFNVIPEDLFFVLD